jgi:hypothetical protein
VIPELRSQKEGQRGWKGIVQPGEEEEEQRTRTFPLRAIVTQDMGYFDRQERKKVMEGCISERSVGST